MHFRGRSRIFFRFKDPLEGVDFCASNVQVALQIDLQLKSPPLGDSAIEVVRVECLAALLARLQYLRAATKLQRRASRFRGRFGSIRSIARGGRN